MRYTNLILYLYFELNYSQFDITEKAMKNKNFCPLIATVYHGKKIVGQLLKIFWGYDEFLFPSIRTWNPHLSWWNLIGSIFKTSGSVRKKSWRTPSIQVQIMNVFDSIWGM